MQVNEVTSSGRAAGTTTTKAAKAEEKTVVNVAGTPKTDKTKGVEVQKTIQKEDIDGKLSDKERAILVRYGFSARQIDNFEFVGITGARIHTDPKTGQKALWLTSHEHGGTYRLEIPIDKDYEPSKINAYRAEDEYNVHFENITGNLVFLQKTDASLPTTNFLAFEGNSKVHIQGLDGAADSVKLVYPAVATFKTGDYADSVIGISSKGNYVEHKLKPGKYNLENRPVK